MSVQHTREVAFLSREDIETRANEIRRQHGLESIPIDPVVLADRLGIRVNNARFTDANMVGMIAKRADAVTLLVNGDDPPYRKRFTIAHQLGHHFLHLVDDGEFLDDEAALFRQAVQDEKDIEPERRMEIQANLFAAALLMPEDAVRSEWQQTQSIRELARRFNVSETAMGIRVDQLGLG